MRHRCLLLTLAIILFPLFSQVKGQSEWAPTGAKWHFCQGTGLGGPECGGYYYLEVAGDSVVGGHACRKISGYRKNWRNQVAPLPDRFTYAENDSVYYYQPDSNRFLLTYDFSAQVGDTLEFPAPRTVPWDPADTSFQVRVDSIVWRPAGQDTLRFFYVSPLDWENWWFYGGWYAEKIGGKMIESPFPTVTIPEIDGFIRCYADDAAFIQFTTEPCDYTLAGWFGQHAELTYGYYDFSSQGYESVRMDGDTVIQGIPCTIFRRTIKKVYTAIPVSGIITQALSPRYAYDVGDQVLAWINNGFYPVYDFNLQPGDTLSFPAENCPEPPAYVVDSVGVVDIQGVSLRFQRVRVLPSGWYDAFETTIIERIGMAYGVSSSDTMVAGFLFPDDVLACIIEAPYRTLRCYSDDEIQLYKTSAVPCDFIVPTRNIPGAADVYVYPNPVSQNFIIRFEQAGDGNRFVLTDALGRPAASGVLPFEENTVHTVPLAAGVYLLSVWTKRGIIVRRVVIQ